MSYVIYNIHTTRLMRVHRRGRHEDAVYKTLGAAKAGFTNAKKIADQGASDFDLKDYAIAESEHFHKSIEKTEVRHGIVHAAGKEFVVPVNTPWTSGPWSETYWSS